MRKYTVTYLDRRGRPIGRPNTVEATDELEARAKVLADAPITAVDYELSETVRHKIKDSPTTATFRRYNVHLLFHETDGVDSEQVKRGVRDSLEAWLDNGNLVASEVEDVFTTMEGPADVENYTYQELFSKLRPTQP